MLGRALLETQRRCDLNVLINPYSYLSPQRLTLSEIYSEKRVVRKNRLSHEII